MIDILGKMMFYLSKRHRDESQSAEFDGDEVRSPAEAMKLHGLKGLWTFLGWHCKVARLKFQVS